MVWCKPALATRQAAPHGAPARQQHTNQPQAYRSRFGHMIQPSKPGDKACQSFNRGTCPNNASHLLDLHVCSFCLRTAHKLCKHPETQCKRKEREAKNGAWGGLRQATPGLHSDTGLTITNSDIGCHTAHLVDIPTHSSASPPAPPISDIHPPSAACCSNLDPPAQA